ncbi:hypothetical protein F5B21DRAFT_508398 [Xylaria acuta]|nr:hypothetical protein F5B21DRAFT_508398 [Xylaria acuta]
MAVNLLDHLIDDCEDPASYPARLRHTHLLPHALRRYEDLLNEQAPRIFSKDSEYWRIRFWDNYNGQPEFPFSVHDCTEVQEIQNYLLCGTREDPICRHVFIEANHSMAPLDCAREMLTSLFTFHQVMPQFLDIVLSFGALPGRNVPTAAHRSIFQYEHLTDPKDAQQYNIPQLGRSGREIRHCYNLWSAEKSDHGKCPWAIRQAGLYHSFDIKMGKAAWIHVKANNVLQKRIREATSSGKRLREQDLQTIHGSFTATLMTHLIVFEWCNENWRQYLSHWECELVEILTKIKEAPIKQAAEALQRADPNTANDFQPIPRQNTFHSTSTVRMTNALATYTPFRRDTVGTASMSSPRLGHHRRQSNFTGTTLVTAQGPVGYMPQIAESEGLNGNSNPYRIFNEFKFPDLHRLYVLSAKIQEADMILGLNANTLTEIVEFYQNYTRDSDTPDAIGEGCRAAMSNFAQRTMKIIAELQNERARIATLISLLEDGKSLFNAIINFRNMEVSRFSSKRVEILTEEMHQSTLQMKTIAEKTEEETASMHTITIVTLVFLPGTFVAVSYALPMLHEQASTHLTSRKQTFLGAGFYQWPDTDEASSIPNYPIWRPSFFYLFVKISLILLAFTLLVWVVSRVRRWILRGRGRIMGIRGRRNKGDEEAQLPETEAEHR